VLAPRLAKKIGSITQTIVAPKCLRKKGIKTRILRRATRKMLVFRAGLFTNRVFDLAEKRYSGSFNDREIAKTRPQEAELKMKRPIY
jgi:hypothetical protein